MSRIVVKNLPDKITKEKLLQIFSEKGKVTDVQLKFTKDGKFRKFAFIGFQKPEYAEAAKESFNKSFINTSQIQIDTCTELGDPNKPRPWSKYAPENIAKKLKKEHNFVENINNEISKSKKVQKGKIKDKKILEMLKNHENDLLFTEFMEANASELSENILIAKREKDTKNNNKNTEMEINDCFERDEGSEEEQKKKDLFVNKDVSDAEYFKLKTGSNINFKEESFGKKKKKKVKSFELFTIKLTGLPLRVKKSQIKEFLDPIKPFTIRRALGMKGVAYCGFKTEKAMKASLLKNKGFLAGKKIFVSAIKIQKSLIDEETEKKWRKENERLKYLETVAESGRIFVRNLPYTASEENLKESFEKFGPITELLFPVDAFTRIPKGFAIISFLIPEHACRAFNELDGTIFQGRMLHLLPALPNKNDAEEEGEDGNSCDTYKAKKLKKEKSKSNSCANWNTFFIGENALAEAMASTYNTSKENVLDDSNGGAAVRLALGETQIINKMKEFLEQNDVCLEAFQNMSVCPRSKTVILVKNLPFGTKVEEIREKFCKFGELKRVVLPPTGVAALVEFIEPSEAKIAFRRIAYSKFKHVPMYLEWAPEKVFRKDGVLEIKKNGDSGEEEEQPYIDSSVATPDKTEIQPNLPPEEGAVLFVKNLNFTTEEVALKEHFSTCGTVLSAKIARKRDVHHPGKVFSMGYGFVEYARKEHADKALKTLQFSNLDDHKIELKRSNRTVAPEVNIRIKASKGSEKPSSKILVRNVPFQATKKEVAELFKVFGEIKAVRLPKKMVGTGTHRGFCFVEFNTIQDAKRAYKALSQSTHFYGRRLVLEWAAADNDVDALREKTASQFKLCIGSNEKKKNITIEERENSGEE